MILKKYFSKANAADLQTWEPFQTRVVMKHFLVFVKPTPHAHEVLLHNDISQMAVQESFGGILLCYGSVPMPDGTFLMFLEHSDGEDKIGTFPGVAHAFLWMLDHGIVHEDLVKNNIFKMQDIIQGKRVTIYVVGDFDRFSNDTGLDTVLSEFNLLASSLRPGMLPEELKVRDYCHAPPEGAYKYGDAFIGRCNMEIKMRMSAMKYLSKNPDASLETLAQKQHEIDVLKGYLRDAQNPEDKKQVVATLRDIFYKLGLQFYRNLDFAMKFMRTPVTSPVSVPLSRRSSASNLHSALTSVPRGLGGRKSTNLFRITHK